MSHRLCCGSGGGQAKRASRKRRAARLGAGGLAAAVLGVGLLVAATGPTGRCRLTVRLVDESSGNAVAGVFRVLGGAGSEGEAAKAVRLEGVLNRGQGMAGTVGGIGDWYVASEAVTVEVPAERLRVEGFSGVETEVAAVEVDLAGVAAKEVRVPLVRTSRVSEGGWYSANTHLHLRGLRRAEADEYLKRIPGADGLDVLFISYLERAGDDASYITNEYAAGDRPELSGEVSAGGGRGVLVSQGEEHRHNFGGQGEGFGHVMMLGLREFVRPASIGPGITKHGNDYPPIRRGIEEARGQGAKVLWCHNNWGMEDVPNWLAGRLAAQNIFDGGTHGGYEDSFYRYLNVGLRVPFSTGTDWFMYDLARVYARVEGGEGLSVKTWLAALEAGRSFITNGPMLEFEVEGQGIGGTVELAERRAVEVRGRVVGRFGVERLELVANGRVVQTVVGEGAEQRRGETRGQALSMKYEVREPCWLALRVASGGKNEYGQRVFGHTSPVYVTVGGRGVFVRRDAEYLMGEMKRAKEAIERQAVFGSGGEKDEVLGVYEEGMAALRKRLEVDGEPGRLDARGGAGDAR